MLVNKHRQDANRFPTDVSREIGVNQVYKSLNGVSSKETVVPRRWGVLKDNLVLSTELIM